MGRAKEFDPEVVLERAMELFWRKGYETTSISDLTEHLGIARASLYATFGSKRGLYLAALDRYRSAGRGGAIALLSRPGPVLPSIRALLDLYAEPARDGQPAGCLVTNAAVECRDPGDRDVVCRLEASWDEVETALTHALLRARAQGELAESANPRALARALLVTLQGMSVLARFPGQADRLRDAADQAFAALPRRHEAD